LVPVVTPKPKVLAPKGQGFLTVGVTSGWANIVLAGRALGPTPIFRQVVPAGKHTLVATRSDGKRKTKTVVIKPNQEVKLSLDWAEP
jgi:hypothetical protein